MGALSRDTHLETLPVLTQYRLAKGVSQQFTVAQALPPSLTLCNAAGLFVRAVRPYSHGEKQLLSLGEEAGAVSWNKNFGLNTTQDLAAQR